MGAGAGAVNAQAAQRYKKGVRKGRERGQFQERKGSVSEKGVRKGSVSYLERGQFHILIIELTGGWILDGMGIWQGSLGWNMRGRFIT